MSVANAFGGKCHGPAFENSRGKKTLGENSNHRAFAKIAKLPMQYP
jgi:hypothetical protein